jgi:hypothetical protein
VHAVRSSPNQQVISMASSSRSYLESQIPDHPVLMIYENCMLPLSTTLLSHTRVSSRYHVLCPHTARVTHLALCVAVILGVRPVIALPSFLWRRRLENLHFTIRTAKLGPTALSKVGFKIRQEGEMGMTSSRTMHDAKRAEGSTWMQETKFSDWSGE